MIWLVLTFVAAGLVMGAAGFGIPLVALPLLIQQDGIQVASPVIALVATALTPFFLWRYRDAIDLRAIALLSIAAYAGVPLGVYLLGAGDRALITRALGVVMLVYGLYAWFTPDLPELKHTLWAVLFGFLAGVLNGAYAIGGIAVIIFATGRRWSLRPFKGNVQTFFLITNLFLLVNHQVSGNLTGLVWRDFAYGFPASVVGLGIGFWLERYLHGQRFRRIVLLLVLAMSVRLIVG